MIARAIKRKVSPYYKRSNMISIKLKKGRKSIVVPKGCVVYLEYEVRRSLSGNTSLSIERETVVTTGIRKGKIVEIPARAEVLRVSMSVFEGAKLSPEENRRVKLSSKELRLPLTRKIETRYSIHVKSASLRKATSISNVARTERAMDSLKKASTGSSKAQVKVLDKMISTKGSDVLVEDIVTKDEELDMLVDGETMTEEGTLGLGTSGMSIEDEIMASSIVEGNDVSDEEMVGDGFIRNGKKTNYMTWGAIGLGAIALVLIARRK